MAGEAQLVLLLCVRAHTRGGRGQAALGRTFSVRAIQDSPLLWGWAMPPAQCAWSPSAWPWLGWLGLAAKSLPALEQEEELPHMQ